MPASATTSPPGMDGRYPDQVNFNANPSSPPLTISIQLPHPSSQPLKRYKGTQFIQKENRNEIVMVVLIVILTRRIESKLIFYHSPPAGPSPPTGLSPPTGPFSPTGPSPLTGPSPTVPSPPSPPPPPSPNPPIASKGPPRSPRLSLCQKKRNPELIIYTRPLSSLSLSSSTSPSCPQNPPTSPPASPGWPSPPEPLSPSWLAAENTNQLIIRRSEQLMKVSNALEQTKPLTDSLNKPSREPTSQPLSSYCDSKSSTAPMLPQGSYCGSKPETAPPLPPVAKKPIIARSPMVLPRPAQRLAAKPLASTKKQSDPIKQKAEENGANMTSSTAYEEAALVTNEAGRASNLTLTLATLGTEPEPFPTENMLQTHLGPVFLSDKSQLKPSTYPKPICLRTMPQMPPKPVSSETKPQTQTASVSTNTKPQMQPKPVSSDTKTQIPARPLSPVTEPGKQPNPVLPDANPPAHVKPGVPDTNRTQTDPTRLVTSSKKPRTQSDRPKPGVPDTKPRTQNGPPKPEVPDIKPRTQTNPPKPGVPDSKPRTQNDPATLVTSSKKPRTHPKPLSLDILKRFEDVRYKKLFI